MSEPHISNEAFSRFLIQACAGMMTALYVAGIQQNYQNTLKGALAQYLNSCWMNLMREDDEFVIKSFEDMNHRSPVCLIHKLFCVGSAVLPDEPLTIGISNPNASRQDKAAAVRPIHTHVMTQAINEVLSQMDLNHPCTGKTVAEERAEWVRKGKPEEGVFTLG
eukprot:CAMPEP_0201477656 /NCGR_PEP_ID=MMETSP0151_2-20130828/2635_1 /ASSEMBLY_ACC=CAM_ASM_000257 /TAXON_ID=200890 /ORGANISM="Paramoeba atlantica, Strain 621/1 / CCAP 1560/9" /LENGTH=163 /DNA_ID=CAMNT_0047858451 /DNA_START=94 /DNA_END=585 /DNA_ORIENTATION=+